jgi:hypothetical protein
VRHETRTHREIDRSINRYTNRPHGRCTDRQTGRQADRQTSRQADKQTGRQTDNRSPAKSGEVGTAVGVTAGPKAGVCGEVGEESCFMCVVFSTAADSPAFSIFVLHPGHLWGWSTGTECVLDITRNVHTHSLLGGCYLFSQQELSSQSHTVASSYAGLVNYTYM